MDNRDSKTNFFFKAFLAGIIGSSALYYYWAVDNESMDLFLANFHSYFGEVLIFWIWLGKQLQVKGWLRAGFIGSMFYSFILIMATNLAEQLIGKPFESLWADITFILISALAGGFGAVPQSYMLKRNLLMAYRWIIVNAIGYGMLRFTYWLSNYSYEHDLFSFSVFIRNMPNVQWLNNLSHAFRYGLLGIILGLALSDIIKNRSLKVSEDA